MRMLASFVLLFFITSIVFGQAQVPAKPDAPPGAAPAPAAPSGPSLNVTEMQSGLKNDLQLIFFAGIGGAVLGLSTLSFVEKPSKELKRVSMGFAIGAILASIFIVYKITSRSMTGGGFTQGYDSIGNSGMDGEIQDPHSMEGEFMDEEGGSGEEEFDENQYDDSSIQLPPMSLLAFSKKGFQFGLPNFNISKDDNSGTTFQANILSVVF